MFVTIEGIDGSGKSTVARAVAAALASKGARVEATAEPTNTWIGQAVRRGLQERLDPWAQTFLFLSDRAQHAQRIRDWLDQGATVVCDRYADSTIAYQSVALGRQDRTWLAETQWARFPKPDRTLWLDVDARTAVARLVGRSHRDPYETEAFLMQVAQVYAQLAAAEPGRWVRVEASGDAREVAERAIALLS